MRFVKKEKMCKAEDGKPYTFIGDYYVKKESKYMTAIYLHPYGLITSKPKWSQAIKLAKLLNNAYNHGKINERNSY